MDTLHDLLVHELQDLYSAENQLVEALPMMADAATDENLKKAFEEHLKQTEEHVKRLEKAGENLEVEVDGITCKAMDGLIKEGQEVLKEDPSEVLDQALIGAAQRVEMCYYTRKIVEV